MTNQLQFAIDIINIKLTDLYAIPADDKTNFAIEALETVRNAIGAFIFDASPAQPTVHEATEDTKRRNMHPAYNDKNGCEKCNIRPATHVVLADPISDKLLHLCDACDPIDPIYEDSEVHLYGGGWCEEHGHQWVTSTDAPGKEFCERCADIRDVAPASPSIFADIDADLARRGLRRSLTERGQYVSVVGQMIWATEIEPSGVPARGSNRPDDISAQTETFEALEIRVKARLAQLDTDEQVQIMQCFQRLCSAVQGDEQVMRALFEVFLASYTVEQPIEVNNGALTTDN